MLIVMGCFKKGGYPESYQPKKPGEVLLKKSIINNIGFCYLDIFDITYFA
jgi:hypothetical protein